jgi:transaldolase
VNFGAEITKIVPGYVSTEVDARLSFDTQGTIDKALTLIRMYEEMGISKDRILIKIAATWEGIKAAEVLESQHNITCNLTLVFHLYQAVACAEAGITLISPFVGRIMDWYKKQQGVDHFAPHDDPGVVSVTQIYNYYKKFGYGTIVMGASFRNVEEIQQLAGCDRLTIAPALLDELIANTDEMKLQLDAAAATLLTDITKVDITEQTFRWNMNDSPMATEKLAEGIRSFAADIVQLEAIVQQKMLDASVTSTKK